MTLNVENMGKNVLIKHSKSKKQQNFEMGESVSAAMLALWSRVRTERY